MVTYLGGGIIEGQSTETSPITASADSGGWVELARATADGTSNAVTTSQFTPKKYMRILIHICGTQGSSDNIDMRVGTSGTLDSSGTNYGQRSGFGGASSEGSQTTSGSPLDMCKFFFNQTSNSWKGVAGTVDVINISGQEKVWTWNIVCDDTTGDDTDEHPFSSRGVGKYDVTSGQIDIISVFHQNTSRTLDTGSEIVVLGWDPADTHSTNFWTELANIEVTSDVTSRLLLDSGTLTPKKYYWIEYFAKQGTTNTSYGGQPTMRVGTGGSGDENQSYAGRTYRNDSADNRHNQREWNIYGGGTNLKMQSTMQLFMTNQSGKEKYIVGTGMDMSDPATTASQHSIKRFYGKYSTTSGQVNFIQVVDVDDGSGVYFKSGSRLKVWGSD